MDALEKSDGDRDGLLLVQPSTACQSPVASWRKVGLAVALAAVLTVGIGVCSFGTGFPHDVSQATIGGITRLDASTHKSWKVFLDLQCPYSKRVFDKLPALKEAFGGTFDITYHITSLPFHPQAFSAQSCAMMLKNFEGQDARHQFIAAAFKHQTRYMNGATGETTRDGVRHIFAQIAREAGIQMHEGDFVKRCDDWKKAVVPAYAEVKEAYRNGVYGTPKHIIDGDIIDGAESAWGVSEWESKLTNLGLLQK